jgi:uncharacterized protein YbaR (Trm112 family)
MHVELVELLRCVQPHEDIWLVASVDRMEDREIISGTLGCPVCHAEYPVRNRVVFFAQPTAPGPVVEPDATEAMRIAAALELTDARATAVLHGAWATHARLIRSLSPARLIVIDPTGAIEPSDGVNVITGSLVQFARQSISGAAVGANASAKLVASLVDALRPGGRMLAPVDLAVPRGLTELARDDEIWVGARSRDEIVQLGRAKTD